MARIGVSKPPKKKKKKEELLTFLCNSLPNEMETSGKIGHWKSTNNWAPNLKGDGERENL